MLPGGRVSWVMTPQAICPESVVCVLPMPLSLGLRDALMLGLLSCVRGQRHVSLLPFWLPAPRTSVTELTANSPT